MADEQTVNSVELEWKQVNDCQNLLSGIAFSGCAKFMILFVCMVLWKWKWKYLLNFWQGISHQCVGMLKSTYCTPLGTWMSAL